MKRFCAKDFVCIYITQFSQYCYKLRTISIAFFPSEKIEIWGICATSQLISGKVGIQRHLYVEY